MGMLSTTGVTQKVLSTDDCLKELSKYGKPRLTMIEAGGWHCCIDVFVNGTGVSFEVKTGYDEKTPNDAANKCIRLLIKAIEQIKDTD